jgi:hypothetical protein
MKRDYLSILLMSFLPTWVTAFANPQFYASALFLPFFHEPRLAKPWLTSGDFQLFGGVTNKSLNSTGHHASLFSLSDCTTFTKCKAPLNSCIDGRLSIVEGVASFAQNFDYGFFAQCIIPFKRIHVSDLQSAISMPDFIQKGIGDCSFFAGWTYNYDETEHLDYIDCTFKIGMLTPTRPGTNQTFLFNLPIGYNGHRGYPITLSGALGAYDWLTLGIYGGLLIFGNHWQKISLLDHANNTIIQSATINPGLLYQGSLYFKADHWIKGISLWVAYMITGKTADSLANFSCLPKTAGYNRFSPWRMHTFHFILEYDFTKEYARFGPRIQCGYHLIIAGKNIVKTNLAGGGFGLDISWCF